MRIGIIGNAAKIKDGKVVERFVKLLTEAGYETVVFACNAEINDVELLIVLGGDGAILHATTIAAEKKIKVIGINYGTLGFLTEYERTDEENVLELIKSVESGKARTLKRSLLKLTKGDETYYALNEVALQRYFDVENVHETQILQLEVQVGESIDVISGDGVLISTPTGSTAYSLSAGGAILMPEVPAFLLTPVCAFSMTKRPIVFSDSETFVVKAKKGKSLVLVDGRAVGYLAAGESVTIEKAAFFAEFPVRNTDFFGKIKSKLNK